MSANVLSRHMRKIALYSLKRWIDVVGSILLLTMSLPLWLIIPLAIKLEEGGPIIYRRMVVGKDGIQFDAFKFRTMVVNADEILARNPQLREEFEKNFKLHNDPRITRVGRLLRRTSLDEFPQLINVLLGQMSLIGPRMISPQELSKFGGQARKLLSVKPGCSGPWVVSGRQDIPYEQRVDLELNYIKNWSLGLDIRLLVKTAMAMFSMRGAC
jgi:lipopolysaccharide/colanic/teichoic acid biosynthesis glycosyltransferase